MKLYDAILVDEAQDFPSSFLRLCYEILDQKKRLVYAYDELQNLSGESLDSPEKIFGSNSDGTPRVALPEPAPGEPKNDIILEKCYRNSRPILVTAHALGFGIYRQPMRNQSIGLVQMFDESALWKDIGYEVVDGSLQEGHEVTLQRKTEASPRFLESHSDIDDLIQFIKFDSPDHQVDWVVDEIMKNLEEDELRYDDILVINPNPLTTAKQVGPIRSRLLEMDINSHLAGVDTDPDTFFQTEHQSITFTGIHRAKGNEAGMVYIINAQDCNSSSKNLASIRNRLFTAITRSKAWVRVLGVGPGMQSLHEEYKEVMNNDFKLNFRYPTKEERKKISIIHRDKTKIQEKSIRESQENLAKLVDNFEAGKILLEDLDEGLIRRLSEALNQ